MLYRIVDDEGNLIEDYYNLTEKEAEIALCDAINNDCDAYITEEVQDESITDKRT